MRLNLSWKDVEQMYNLTRSAQNFFLNIGSMFSNKSTDKSDDGIKLYCQAEYGENWYWAYSSYKIDGRFPNPYDN